MSTPRGLSTSSLTVTAVPGTASTPRTPAPPLQTPPQQHPPAVNVRQPSAPHLSSSKTPSAPSTSSSSSSSSLRAPQAFTFSSGAAPVSATFNSMLAQQPSNRLINTSTLVEREPSPPRTAPSPFNAFISQHREQIAHTPMATRSDSPAPILSHRSALSHGHVAFAGSGSDGAVPEVFGNSLRYGDGELQQQHCAQPHSERAGLSPSLSPPPTAQAFASFVQKSARHVVVSPPPGASPLGNTISKVSVWYLRE